MAYTVTFYAQQHDLGEVVVSVHRVERSVLAAYTGTPSMALAAARNIRGESRADGFRVVDEGGRVVLDYVDRPGRG